MKNGLSMVEKSSVDPQTREIKRPWYVPEPAARRVDDLSFTGRDESGRRDWFCASNNPRTGYTQAHEMAGRCCAFEVLDMIHNKESELNGHELGFILSGVARHGSESVQHGFFEVISEFLTSGHVNR